MSRGDIEERVMRAAARHIANGVVTRDSTPAALGLDSMDLIELMLDLEELFPGVDLDSYEPAMETPLCDVAMEIKKRMDK